MANAFAKAKEKVAAVRPAAARRRETTWVLGADPQEERLGEAIHEVVALTAEAKAAEAKAALLKSRLLAFAEDRWLAHICATGVLPEPPTKLVNRDGEAVTFVVQDRATGYAIKDEVLEAVVEAVGQGTADEIVFTQDVFAFNPAVMAQPAGDGRAVVEVVGEKIGSVIERLVRDGLLTQEQGDALLTAKQVRTFRPGLLERLPQICGQRRATMVAFLAAVGSAVVRFVKS